MHKPAAESYAEVVGTTVKDAPDHFMSHPLGLLAGEEIFVRSPQQIKDGEMVFYCSILEGTELALLTSTEGRATAVVSSFHPLFYRIDGAAFCGQVMKSIRRIKYNLASP